MADQKHLEILYEAVRNRDINVLNEAVRKKNKNVWDQWRENYPDIVPDLSQEDLSTAHNPKDFEKQNKRGQIFDFDNSSICSMIR